MKTQRALLALTLWLSACAPVTNTAYPPPTQDYPAPATATVAPTAVPTTPAPPTETPAPTATEFRWSKPWRIWFEGFSCEGLSECGTFPGAPYAFFSILSDGSDLKPLELDAFPTTSVPQEFPDTGPNLVISHDYSVDGTALAYVSRESLLSRTFRLYVAHLQEARVELIYETPVATDQFTSIAGLCWSSDSSSIRFVMTTRTGNVLSPPIMFSIASDGTEMKRLYAIDELVGVVGGVCSPDKQEIVMVQASGTDPDHNQQGFYRLSWSSGRWEQILGSYYIWRSVRAPNEYQP